MFEHQVQEQTGRHEAPETDYVLFVFQERWHNPSFPFFFCFFHLLVYVQSHRSKFTSASIRFASALVFFLQTLLNQSGAADWTMDLKRAGRGLKVKTSPRGDSFFIDSIEMPSVIPSPEVQWLSECHCRCLWDDPACFHPSQPPMAERWKAWREWYFKYSIKATFEGCWEGEIRKGAGLCFMCFSAGGKKHAGVRTFCRICSCALTWESGGF